MVALGSIKRVVSPARPPQFTPPGKLHYNTAICGSLVRTPCRSDCGHYSRRCMIKRRKVYSSRIPITDLMLFGRRSYVTQMIRQSTQNKIRKEALIRGKFQCAGTGGNWRKLEEWANGHSACYNSKFGVETLEGGIPLNGFKHCPCSVRSEG